jgi:uncharacterized membrane protein
MRHNLGRVDRLVRLVAGVALIAAGLFVLRGVPAVVACLSGALLMYSGAVGFCHVCKVFNVHTSKNA